MQNFLLPLICCLLGIFLGGCSTPAPRVADPQIANQLKSAHQAYKSGAVAQAEKSFEQALKLAHLQDSNPEIARAAYNLAVCLADQQKWEQASQKLLEARTASTAPHPIEFTILDIKISRGAGDLTKAVQTTKDLLKTLPGSSAFYPMVSLLLADLLCELKEFDASREILKKITLKTVKALNPSCQADFWRVKALTAEHAGNLKNAGKHFDQAAIAYSQAGMYLEMANCLENAGKACLQDGADSIAANRFYRAARSFRHQGALAKAKTLLSAAGTLTSDQDLLSLIKQLENEISILEKQASNTQKD